jgi:hypothetical protein
MRSEKVKNGQNDKMIASGRRKMFDGRKINGKVCGVS